jgi:hypothetical protein
VFYQVLFHYFDRFLAEFFSREVFALLLGEELISEAVVDRIIHHLKLTFVAERPPPPQIAFQELLMAEEAGGEYFS